MAITPTLNDDSTRMMQRQGTPYAQALAQLSASGMDPTQIMQALNSIGPRPGQTGTTTGDGTVSGVSSPGMRLPPTPNGMSGGDAAIRALQPINENGTLPTTSIPFQLPSNYVGGLPPDAQPGSGYSQINRGLTPQSEPMQTVTPPPGNVPTTGGGAMANPLASSSGLSTDQFTQLMQALTSAQNGGGAQPQQQSAFQQDPFSALGMVNAPQWAGVPNVGMPAFSQGAQVGTPSPFAPVAQVGAPPTPEAYRQALQAANQPMFDDQARQLAAREASMGVLDSGGARKDFSDLTARNNATLAAGMQPLIQQGFGQQFSASEQNAGAANALDQQMTGLGFNAQTFNAGNNQQSNLSNQNAYNSYLQALQGQAYGGQQSQLDRLMQASGANASSRNNLLGQLNQLGFQAGSQNATNSLQAQEFNQQQLEQLMSQNLGIQSQYGLAQLGYGHQDYSQALGAMAGLEGTGLSNLGSILGNGMNNQWGGYLSGQNTGAGYANQIGYTQGYGSTRPGTSATGVYQSGGASQPDGTLPVDTTGGYLGDNTYTPGGAAT